MPIEFHCSNCSKKIRVADAAAGKRVRCPACSEVVTSPDAPPSSLFADMETSQEPPGDPNGNIGGRVNPYSAPLSGSLQPAPNRPKADYVLADRGARLVAAIADNIATFAPVLGGLFLGWLFVIAFENSNSAGPVFLICLIGGVILMFAVAVYNMVLTAYTGETIGKRMLSIRVVKESDGTAPGFVHGVLLRNWVMILLNQLPFVGLIDVLLIFGEDRKCLHDVIASTRVVDGRYSPD